MATSDLAVVRSEERELDGLVVAAVVAGAAELARKGRYAEAESLLRERLAAGKTEPPVLDLLARIEAQRGRLREAEEQWQRAASLDPGNESYRAGLRRLARLQRRRVHWPWLAVSRLGMAAALTVLVLFAVWASVARLGIVQAREVGLATNREADVGALAERVHRLEQAIPATNEPARTTAPAPPAELRLDLPGVTLRSDGPALVASFDDGLFGAGDRLGARGRELLTALGHALEPLAGTITVSVVGHADDRTPRADSRFPDNEALALARALAVVEHLRATTTLPAEVFQLQTAGTRHPPFPNDSPANRARNRTVVLRITRAQAPDPG